jgi:hypothetical protein
MAAITPSNILVESAGSTRMHVATFVAASSPGDIWTSGIQGVVFACAQGIGSATGANVSASFSATNATSTNITFGGGVSVTQPAFVCMILSKS